MLHIRVTLMGLHYLLPYAFTSQGQFKFVSQKQNRPSPRSAIHIFPLHMLMSLMHGFEMWGRVSSVIMVTRIQDGLPVSIFDRVGFLFTPPRLDTQNKCLQMKVRLFSRLFQTVSDSVRSISHLLCNETLCIIGVQPLR